MGCLFIKGGMATNGNGSVAARKKPSLEVSRETREALKSTAFDVWKHHDSEEVWFEWGTKFYPRKLKHFFA